MTERDLALRDARSLPPRKRAEALLETFGGSPLLRAIPSVDAYALILEIGLDDANDLLEASTPQQFRSYIDLAAWHGDRLVGAKLMRWLSAGLGDHFLQKLKGLDLEVLELLLHRSVRIHDIDEDDGAPEIDGPAIETPDHRYLIELLVEGEEESSAVRSVIDALVADDPFGFSRLLEAIRWETDSDLEEAAYNFRVGRLEELGFPPLEVAQQIMRRIAPADARRRAGFSVAERSSALVPLAASTDYVSAAFRGLDASERAHVEVEVRRLANCVLVVDGADPGDLPAIHRSSELARAQLHLALEYLTSAAPESATDVIRTLTLEEIYRVGLALTQEVRREARLLAREPAARWSQGWWALDEEASDLDAFLRNRPTFGDGKPFRSLAEISRGKSIVARARRQGAVLQAFLGNDFGTASALFSLREGDVTPQRLFATGVAEAVALGKPGRRPLPSASIGDIADALAREGVGGLSLRIAREPEQEECAEMVQRVLRTLAEELLRSRDASKIHSILFAES